MPSPLLQKNGVITRVLAKLRSLRLARLTRLLLRGQELRLLDKIKLNYYPSHEPLQITFDKKPFHVADAESFLGAYKEIFFDRVYGFLSTTSKPFIIDGGANIGLATTFFKQLYPRCRVVAFEPDPVLYAALSKNVVSLGLQDVDLINAAIWNSDTSVSFISEGGGSGHIPVPGERRSSASVKAVRLKPWLNEKVDFVKLDLEGAEYEVLEDCREDLASVHNLFVEYHSPANSEQKLSRILEILSSAGFRYHIHEAHTSSHPFLSRTLLGEMDLQLNISAFRPSST